MAPNPPAFVITLPNDMVFVNGFVFQGVAGFTLQVTRWFFNRAQVSNSPEQTVVRQQTPGTQPPSLLWLGGTGLLRKQKFRSRMRVHEAAGAE